MRNLRFTLVPLVVLPVAWLMFQGLGRDPREIPSPLVGRPAPAFTLQSMDGEEVSLAVYRGRPVLVNFWASWCFECIAEHRVLMEAQARYGDSFAIVGILYQASVADARGFLLRHGDGGWPVPQRRGTRAPAQGARRGARQDRHPDRGSSARHRSPSGR